MQNENPPRSRFFSGKNKTVTEVSKTQGEMIENITTLDDVDAKMMMTHRVDIVALSKDATIAEAVALAIESGVSRMPVFDGDIDTIVGIIYVKDFLPLIGKSVDGLTISDYIRGVLFVSESAKSITMFKELTANKVQIAIVVDEFGGTSGIVTIEDILEGIVGNIEDEFDENPDEVVRVGGNTFKIAGDTDIEVVAEATGLGLEKSEDFDTIGGFLIDALGYIPHDGDKPEVKIEDIPATFHVERVEDRRIEEVRVEL